MTDTATMKVNEAFERARRQVAEEAKKPRPAATSFAAVKAFVESARVEVTPGTEYYKGTDKTLTVLENRDGEKLEIDACLLAQLLEEGASDPAGRATCLVLKNAHSAVTGYAGSIDSVRNGTAPAAASRPLCRVA